MVSGCCGNHETLAGVTSPSPRSVSALFPEPALHPLARGFSLALRDLMVQPHGVWPVAAAEAALADRCVNGPPPSPLREPLRVRVCHWTPEPSA